MPKISKERRELRRLQVLEAATRCFARNGFHGTAMEDIVRESGLSPGAIYCYFRGKQEIVETITAQRHARDSLLLESFAAPHRLDEALEFGGVSSGDLPRPG